MKKHQQFLIDFHYSHSSRATGFLSIFYEMAFHKLIYNLFTADFSPTVFLLKSCTTPLIQTHLS